MVNCNYALVVNPKKKAIFFRNKEGLWQLQASVLMYCWENSEAPFVEKELRLEITIAATKSNATGTHTCHDIIIIASDANCGIKYASVILCVTIRGGKPYIVGEKVGSFNIINESLSNVSVEENTATVSTTNLNNIFWGVTYDPLPWLDFVEEVALRDLTQEEAQVLLSDILNRLSIVMETEAVTTNTQNMIMLKTKVATTAYIGDELTIAGPAASKEGLLSATQIKWTENYKSLDDNSDFAMISIKMDTEHWVLPSLNWGTSCRNIYSPPSGNRINRIILPPCDLVRSKKNLMRSNSDYSVNGSDNQGVMTIVNASDVSTKVKELGVSWTQEADSFIYS